MPTLRTFAALVLACTYASFAPAQEKSWAGKTILLKKYGIDISHTDKATGEQVRDATLTGIDYKVLAEQGDWIRVRQAGVEGWLKKTDAVLLEDAVAYFTQRVNENEKDDQAFMYRGMAW